MRIGIKGSAKNRFVRQRKKKQVRTYEGKVLLVLIEALVHCDTIKSRTDRYLINANVLNC